MGGWAFFHKLLTCHDLGGLGGLGGFAMGSTGGNASLPLLIRHSHFQKVTRENPPNPPNPPNYSVIISLR